MTTTDCQHGRLLFKYKNGNCHVSLYKNGTKVREWPDNEIAYVEYPESIDVKITNYCDLGCSYCHESSTVEGKHANLNVLLDVLKPLCPGTELAIGGGNPLSHPELREFLEELQGRSIVANLTVNQGHLIPYQDYLRNVLSRGLIKGLGISITNKNYEPIKPLLEISDNIVYHVIAGVNPISVIDDLVNLGNPKILVLGYKTFGRGTEFYREVVRKNIMEWFREIRRRIGKVHLSFDNLAIEQLEVRRLFTKEGWDEFYMGDDGMFTMYIDAVNQEFAKTSRSLDRVSFGDTSLQSYFKTLYPAK